MDTTLAIRPTSAASLTATEEPRKWIVTGQLPPGASLRPELLAAEPGVSRLPIMDAPAKLNAEGLVTAHLRATQQLVLANIDDRDAAHRQPPPPQRDRRHR